MITVTKEHFSPGQILASGQCFRMTPIQDGGYVVVNGIHVVKITPHESCGYVFHCSFDKFRDIWIPYFDFRVDYAKYQKKMAEDPFLQKAIEMGGGIRILKQELVETIVSFIFSANNNIKRFTASLNQLRQDFGNEISIENEASQRIKELISSQKFFSFPNLKALLKLDEAYFSKIGAGYRAPYLFETIKALPNFLAEDFSFMSTDQLLKELVSLKGVGRKVAQCVMLFGFGRVDCFPVDTWIKQVYNDLNRGEDEKNEQQISSHLIKIFGNYSGYAQQYLFYYKRELKQLV